MKRIRGHFERGRNPNLRSVRGEIDTVRQTAEHGPQSAGQAAQVLLKIIERYRRLRDAVLTDTLRHDGVRP